MNTTTEQEERSSLVDIVRGFAFTGVLIANFNSYTEQQVPEYRLESISSSVDRTLMAFNSVFLEWKFMALFSILFGYSFGLILQRMEKKNVDPFPFFIRRLSWLFVFGVIHCLFWWGDVLNLYAMSGIFLLLFTRSSNRFILSCGLLFTLVLPVLIQFLLRNLPDTFTAEDIRQLYNEYKQGSVLQVMAFNVDFYYRMFVISWSNLHDVIETLGRFLLGYYLVRIDLLNNVERKSALFRKAGIIAFPFAASYLLFRWLLTEQAIHPGEYLRSFLLSAGIMSTTCFYVCILVLLHIHFGTNRFFNALQAIGRMTLTNYLAVSAFLVVMLYGFGFDMLGEIPIHTTWLFAGIWLALEIAFSTYWLKRYRYGPVEWIWRQLTLGKQIGLRKSEPAR